MAANSGQVTVAVAGTAVQFPDRVVAGPVSVKAHPDNTDVVYVGNDGAGDVSNANGLPLAAGEELYLKYVHNLNVLWADADTSGEKLAWHIREV